MKPRPAPLVCSTINRPRLVIRAVVIPFSPVGQNGDEAFLSQPEYSPERKERLKRIVTTPKPSRKSDKRAFRMEAHQAASGGNRPGHISVLAMSLPPFSFHPSGGNTTQ